MDESVDDEFYLYFIFRSVIMGVLGAVLFSLFVWALGLTDLAQILTVSIVNFFLALFISRLFDGQIRRSVERIMKILRRHPRMRSFVLKNF